MKTTLEFESSLTPSSPPAPDPAIASSARSASNAVPTADAAPNATPDAAPNVAPDAAPNVAPDAAAPNAAPVADSRARNAERCRTLVIYTHPNHESLSYAFLQKVLQGIGDNRRSGEVQVLDLYAEGFNPALVFNREKRRRDMYRDPDLAKYREQLLWADRLVLVYPIWWGRPPAMLLGYIDQMFAANFAYRDRKGLLPEGLLKGKSVVCVSTMKGPALYPLLWLHNAHKILMKRALFGFVGIRKVKFFEFGRMESPKGGQARKLEKVYRYFRQAAGR